MLNSPQKRARVRLTPEQIDAIRHQTGLDSIPETLVLSFGGEHHGTADEAWRREVVPAAFGLIHELNRT